MRKRACISFLSACLVCQVLSPPCVAPRAYAADETLEEDFKKAATELTFFNFDIAYEQFQKLRRRVEGTTDNDWQRVTFGLALSAQNRTPPSAELIGEAESLYKEILTQAPESKFAPRSKLNLGRIAEVRDYGGDVVDLDTARQIYREVFENPQWASMDIADEAALRYADTYVQHFEDIDSIREGLSFLESWIEARPEASTATVIWEYIGTTKLVLLKDYAGAVEGLVKADQLGLIEKSQAGEVFWNIAETSHRQLQDWDTAIRYYQKIILETPRSGKAFEAQLALREIAEQFPDRQIEVPEVPQLLGGSFAPDEDPAQSPDASEVE